MEADLGGNLDTIGRGLQLRCPSSIGFSVVVDTGLHPAVRLTRVAEPLQPRSGLFVLDVPWVHHPAHPPETPSAHPSVGPSAHPSAGGDRPHPDCPLIGEVAVTLVLYANDVADLAATGEVLAELSPAGCFEMSLLPWDGTRTLYGGITGLRAAATVNRAVAMLLANSHTLAKARAHFVTDPVGRTSTVIDAVELIAAAHRYPLRP